MRELNLGKAIVLCRNQKNISQRDLAEMSGLSVSYISLLERNKRDPNLSTVVDIANALEMPFIFLVALMMDMNELAKTDLRLAEVLSLSVYGILIRD